MNKKTIKTFKIISLLIALGFGVGTVSALTNFAPTATPPNNNISAPVDTSSTPQIKAGGLTINNTSPSSPKLTVGYNFTPPPSDPVDGLIYAGFFGLAVKGPSNLVNLGSLGSANFGTKTAIGDFSTESTTELLRVRGRFCSDVSSDGPAVNIATIGGSQTPTEMTNTEILFKGNLGSNIYSPSSNLYLLAGVGKTLNLGSNNTDSQVFLTEGYVGIGTDQPKAKLSIENTASDNLILLQGSDPSLALIAGQGLYNGNPNFWRIHSSNNLDVNGNLYGTFTIAPINYANPDNYTFSIDEDNFVTIAGVGFITSPTTPSSLPVCANSSGGLIRCP